MNVPFFSLSRKHGRIICLKKEERKLLTRSMKRKVIIMDTHIQSHIHIGINQ